MKRFASLVLALLVFGLFAGSCSLAPPVQEHMIIAPTTFIFSHSTDSATVSITHSCSCPFSWNDSIYPPASWLVFPSSLIGDKTDVPISIDTTKLVADTNRVTLYILSNSYGIDSIAITAIK